MTDVVLEFSDVCVENMGHLNPGKIKFSDQNVVFKNTKTGKLDQISTSQISSCAWIKVGNKPGLKIIENDGVAHRYGGFSSEVVNITGPNLGFNVDGKECFEVPLSNVSNCSVGKNEAILEFHQNEDCPVSLMEMRFHIPNEAVNEEDIIDRVEEFKMNVLKYAASAAEESDDKAALVTLEEIFCSTPRGRYDIKIFPSHLSLHGKTFDYKIPIKTILRLFLLPHKDGNRMFFVVSLDPPIRQGQTRYHYLVLEFSKDEEVDVEMGLSQEQLDEKYNGKLQKEMSGPVYEVLSRIMRALCNQRITVPGGFVGHSGTPAISCAFKQAAGFLYPLEKGFVYVHKPPMYIRFEDISCVNFARSDVSTRSFDFEVELRTETVYLFNSIEKEEYTRLYDFVEKKKLRIRNSGKRLDKVSYKEDDFAGSSDEAEIDPYKEKLKKEAKAREEEQDEEESDSEDADSDYNPDVEQKKKAAKKARGSDSGATSGSEPNEEFDSDAGKSSGSAAGGGSDATPKKKKKKVEKPKKKKSAPEKKKKGGKDPSQPKKAQSAYMLWFQANRESLKEPGMAVTEVAKKAGQVWREMSDKTRWEKKAAEDKTRYQKEMEVWRKGGGASTSSKARASAKPAKKSSPTKQAKSKEYISESDDSSESDKGKKKGKGSDHDESGSEDSDSGSD